MYVISILFSAGAEEIRHQVLRELCNELCICKGLIELET